MLWLLLTIRFALELALLVALSWVGFHLVDTGALRYVLMVSLPIAASLIWAVFVAPKRRVNLPAAPRFAIELILFAAAAFGLYALGAPRAGLALAGLECVIGSLNLAFAPPFSG